MNRLKYFLYLSVSLLWFFPLHAEQAANDQDRYESLTGLKGTYNEKESVFKASFPRNDVKILIDGIQIDPFMGLTSWSAFTPIDKNNFMVMGDIVLLQDEVNPVMSTLLNNNIEVTALHNHFFYDNPKVYFMHIGGKGFLNDLGNGVKKAMDTIKEVRSKNVSLPNHFEGSSISSQKGINQSVLETILGAKGQNKAGMVKFVFGRTVQMGNTIIGNEMGVNTWAAFAGNNENAVVDGDFAVLENELQPVLKALRKGNINIVAIHHHMIMENPRMIFLHYWGKGNAEDLAKTIKAALNLTKQ